jgi:hypothetical protein
MIKQKLKPECHCDPRLTARREEALIKATAWNLSMGLSDKIDPPAEDYRRARELLKEKELID